MLLSIHVPKAAGNSFREALMGAYGDRIMLDYGDWAGFNTPESNARRALRTEAMRARRDELASKYNAIHGHFVADKYVGLFDDPQFTAFFRDPYQQSIAHYYFLERNPQRNHPEEKFFHDAKMSIIEYLEWDAFHNHQSQFLGNLSVDDLAFVGLSEEYETSLAMFEAVFGFALEVKHENVNPHRQEAGYHVDPEVRRAVDRYRAADVELYERAKAIFARQLRRVA
jgi:hypothetical protein